MPQLTVVSLCNNVHIKKKRFVRYSSSVPLADRRNRSARCHDVSVIGHSTTSPYCRQISSHTFSPVPRNLRLKHPFASLVIPKLFSFLQKTAIWPRRAPGEPFRRAARGRPARHSCARRKVLRRSRPESDGRPAIAAFRVDTLSTGSRLDQRFRSRVSL